MIDWKGVNLFEKIGSSFSKLVLALVLLLGETTEDPVGIRVARPIAGVFAFMGFWMVRAYRLSNTVTRESVKAAALEL